MALPADFKLETFLPPALYTADNGQLYVVAGVWIPVPSGTTLEEVQERWTRKLAPRDPNELEKPKYKISEEVLSSKGDSSYLVTFNNGYWNCECIGFQCRKKCRHVTEVMVKHIQTQKP